MPATGQPAEANAGGDGDHGPGEQSPAKVVHGAQRSIALMVAWIGQAGAGFVQELMNDSGGPCRVLRDDGLEDSVTRMTFSSYDEAYDELARFYADLCCSDDRIEYSIVRSPKPVSPPPDA